jgi:hypothetical protein
MKTSLSLHDNVVRRSVASFGRVVSLAAIATQLAMSGCTASASGTVSASTASGSCVASSSVSCTTGSGYSCSGSAQPEDTTANLVCSTDSAGNFCCVSGGTCGYDANVVGCESGSVGYSCTSGSQPPEAADPSLVCSDPTTANGLDEYCCYTNTAVVAASTCSQDASVAGCQTDSAGNPSYGFSCTGSDAPGSDYSNLNCSTGTPGTDAQGNSAQLYCCAYTN